MAKVGIVMGSDSDMPVMSKAADVLAKLGVDFEMTIISAHREPDVFFEYAKSAEAKGFKVIIAGAGKAKRYGEEFCKLIKRHCEENEIERPEDLRVRTVANKSKMKVAIIQAIDRKVALDDIALSKGIEFGELLDEVEAIVYSGTKLNIDYFLEEIMDEDHMLDIYDYFKESTTDKIDDALDELGDDFTEEEVRLVRIKFISEMAN